MRGLGTFPQNEWPDKIALLYYSYHVMVGLGTIFIAVMVMAAFLYLAREIVHSEMDAVDIDDLRAASRISRTRRGG